MHRTIFVLYVPFCGHCWYPQLAYVGGFYTRTGEDQFDSAPARFGLVTERQLFFASDRLRETDFEYRFDGEFLRTDFDAVAGKNKAVLRGTLTKMKNGRTVAQHVFTFRMEYLGC